MYRAFWKLCWDGRKRFGITSSRLIMKEIICKPFDNFNACWQRCLCVCVFVLLTYCSIDTHPNINITTHKHTKSYLFYLLFHPSNLFCVGSVFLFSFGPYTNSCCFTLNICCCCCCCCYGTTCVNVFVVWHIYKYTYTHKYIPIIPCFFLSFVHIPVFLLLQQMVSRFWLRTSSASLR